MGECAHACTLPQCQGVRKAQYIKAALRSRLAGAISNKLSSFRDAPRRIRDAQLRIGNDGC
jgi:hypothetical protein